MHKPYQYLTILLTTALITWLGTGVAKFLFHSYYTAEYGISAPYMHYTWYPHRLSQVSTWAMLISACVGLIAGYLIVKRVNKKANLKTQAETQSKK